MLNGPLNGPRIAVSISLINEISPVVANILRDLGALNASVVQVEKSLGRWGKQAELGALVIGGALAKVASAGSEILHQQQMMAIAGLQ
jgi:hypothetical protein